ncbi:hypothetical protein G5714_024711 [Onychostoma macrolepis]|uniref:Uncharacterized protein n=1 Tax=Onychostoma macrolepis TaxID=369639 RepID=A0A7J6BI22_9TELE|nr:hypothetical protein G5714_024711 [Onychostoma macrolepis]
MFGPSPVFDLVVFERNSSRVHSRGRAESRPGREGGRGPRRPYPPLVTPKPYPDGTSKRLPLTDRPPARGRDRAVAGKARSPGQGHRRRGVGSSTLARNETPRPSDSKLGTQVDPDGPYPTPPPRVDNPPGAGGDKLCQTRGRSRPPGPLSNAAFPVDTPPGAGDRHPCFRHPHPPLTPLLPDSEASHRPPLLRGHLRRTTPTCSPAEPGLPHLSRVTDSTNRALRRTGPLVTLGEIYRWSPGKSLPLVTRERFTAGHPHRLRFWPPLPRTSRVPGGLCEPDLQNHDSGLRGTRTPLYRLREPGPRAEATLLHPLYRLREPGPRAEATLLHPLYRLREPGPRAEGPLSCTPLPPQGTRTSGRGGHSPAPPLPASGNQDLGQRGTVLHPSTRLELSPPGRLSSEAP